MNITEKIDKFLNEGKAIEKLFKSSSSEDISIISIYSELKKEPKKYKEAINYMNKFGSNWEKINLITLTKLIKDKI